MAAGPRERVTKPGVQVDSSVAFPVGTLFHLVGGESVALQLPVSEVAAVEIVVWPAGGVSVRVPYRGDHYVILDGEGRELDRL